MIVAIVAMSFLYERVCILTCAAMAAIVAMAKSAPSISGAPRVTASHEKYWLPLCLQYRQNNHDKINTPKGSNMMSNID